MLMIERPTVDKILKAKRELIKLKYEEVKDGKSNRKGRSNTCIEVS